LSTVIPACASSNSDQHEDLITEGIDITLRFGPLSDSNAVARKVL
jgi:hypothetical protein